MLEIQRQGMADETEAQMRMQRVMDELSQVRHAALPRRRRTGSCSARVRQLRSSILVEECLAPRLQHALALCVAFQPSTCARP